MPEINIDTRIDVDVDVDIEDVLDECSDDEIKEVIKWLKANDYLADEKIITDPTLSPSEIEYYDNVEKLQDMYLVLTQDDYLTIKHIIEKY